MDYDTYGSNAVELAIDLANAERDDPAVGARSSSRSHGEWFTPGTSLDLSRPPRPAHAARPPTWSAPSPSPSPRTTSSPGSTNCSRWPARSPTPPTTTASCTCTTPVPEAPVLEQLTTTVAMGLSQVVVQHGWQRLGVCSAEGCDDVYVDTSRNASRRYCSNTCASRSTVAAYRARQKA